MANISRRKANGPAYYQRRINRALRDPDVADQRAFQDFRTDALSRSGDWVNWRGLGHYNAIFAPGLQSMGLGSDVVDALTRIPRGKQRKLRSYEEGPGTGVYAAESADSLNEKGIELDATVVDRHHPQQLGALKSAGKINRMVMRSSESYYPRQRQHVIFSVAGPINYTISALRKDHVLKLANSLTKGGLMMVAFDVLEPIKPGDIFAAQAASIEPLSEPEARRLVEGRKTVEENTGMKIPYGLSQDPMRDRVLPLEVEMRGIERAFHRRGFRARFFPTVNRGKLPPWNLIVQRTDQPLRGKRHKRGRNSPRR